MNLYRITITSANGFLSLAVRCNFRLRKILSSVLLLNQLHAIQPPGPPPGDFPKSSSTQQAVEPRKALYIIPRRSNMCNI